MARQQANVHERPADWKPTVLGDLRNLAQFLLYNSGNLTLAVRTSR
jgi:hypothetical protein